jgi:DNA-binding beta-propeller fold protein YncE
MPKIEVQSRHGLVALTGLLLAASVLTASSVFAGLIGVSSSERTGPSVLYSIDTTTGLATPVLTLSTELRFTGIDFLGGELYVTDAVGVDCVGCPGDFFLGTIDRTTGKITSINNQEGALNWWGLAAKESAGLLYTVDGDAGNVLKSVTPAGVITTIGPTGVTDQGAGLAYDPLRDLLYATAFDGNLYTIDMTTGASTLVGPLGLPLLRNVHQGLAYDPIGQILYFNEADTFDSLYCINTMTGAATLIGVNGSVAGDGIDGLAVEPSATPIPEPASLVLLVTGVLSSLTWRAGRKDP